jgi:hypothetical protein
MTNAHAHCPASTATRYSYSETLLMCSIQVRLLGRLLKWLWWGGGGHMTPFHMIPHMDRGLLFIGPVRHIKDVQTDDEQTGWCNLWERSGLAQPQLYPDPMDPTRQHWHTHYCTVQGYKEEWRNEKTRGVVWYCAREPARLFFPPVLSNHFG